MDIIPVELVGLILNFVPVRSRLPSTFVCKLWRLLIDNKKLTHRLFCYDIENVSVLRWARRNGCPITSGALKTYAKRGRLDLILAAFQTGCDDFNFKGIFREAMIHNHTDILAWLLPRVSIAEDDVYKVVGSCTGDTLGYVTSNWPGDHYINYDKIMGLAAKNGNVFMIEWLIRKSGGIDRCTLKTAIKLGIKKGHFKIFKMVSPLVSITKYEQQACIGLAIKHLTPEELDMVAVEYGTIIYTEQVNVPRLLQKNNYVMIDHLLTYHHHLANYIRHRLRNVPVDLLISCNVEWLKTRCQI